MKLIIVRMKRNKEPVMVLGGHAYDYDFKENELYWRIDECTDPSACEIANIEIDDTWLGFMWGGQLNKSDEGDYVICDDISLSGDFGAFIGNYFADDSLGWADLA